MVKQFEEYAPGARAIIVTAENLFGKYGLDGASLRQILVAAGQANPSAIHHHFGTKAGLILATYRYRTPKLEAARQVKLDLIDKENRSSFDDLLGALLEPVVEILGKRERLLYARFMIRLLPLSATEHPYFKSLDICAPSVEIAKRMRASFPALPPDVVDTRTRLAVSAFLQGIWDEQRVRGLSSGTYPSTEMYWDEIFQNARAIFLNPYPPPARFRNQIAELSAPQKPDDVTKNKLKRRVPRTK